MIPRIALATVKLNETRVAGKKTWQVALVWETDLGCWCAETRAGVPFRETGHHPCHRLTHDYKHSCLTVRVKESFTSHCERLKKLHGNFFHKHLRQQKRKSEAH